MNWMDIDETEMINLERIVRAHASEDGMGTVLYDTSYESFTVPVQYQTFRALAIYRKQKENNASEATNLTLQKILSGQTTQVP